MVSRKAMVVYFQSKKVEKEIEKLGVNITYINVKMNYLIGYVDAISYDKVKKQIANLRHVRKVEDSLLEMETFDFNE
ncbi:MAG: YlbG family protein [Firmicutes bacterium]|nr:YlbG family protein [Bacillota bacterium]